MFTTAPDALQLDYKTSVCRSARPFSLLARTEDKCLARNFLETTAQRTRDRAQPVEEDRDRRERELIFGSRPFTSRIWWNVKCGICPSQIECCLFHTAQVIVQLGKLHAAVGLVSFCLQRAQISGSLRAGKCLLHGLPVRSDDVTTARQR